MAQKVAVSPSTPVTSPASSAALPPLVIPMPRIFGANPPSLKGRATPVAPLPKAPKNDEIEIRRIKNSISGCKSDIRSLNDIKKDLEKDGIDNNAEKLILVAECHIRIININISKLPPGASITEDDARAPLEYLNKALRALSTHRYEGRDKYHLLQQMLNLYDQIKTSPSEIAASRIQCQVLSYTFQIEDTNELLEKGNFGEAGETVPTLTSLPPNPVLTPEHLISIIAILNAMANHEEKEEDKLGHTVRVQHFARSGLEKIQRLKDIPQQVKLLKSLEAEVSKVITQHPGQKPILGPLHIEIKSLLNALEPKWYHSPRNITFVALGALAVFAACFTAYRRWHRA